MRMLEMLGMLGMLEMLEMRKTMPADGAAAIVFQMVLGIRRDA